MLDEFFFGKVEMFLDSQPNLPAPFCHRMDAGVRVETGLVGAAKNGEVVKDFLAKVAARKGFDVGSTPTPYKLFKVHLAP